jgi:hypothetical protein
MGEMRNACNVLVCKPEGKSTQINLGVDIRMDLREIGWKNVDCIHMSQDRGQWRSLVNTVMNLRVSYEAGNFLTVRVTTSIIRRTLLHGVS